MRPDGKSFKQKKPQQNEADSGEPIPGIRTVASGDKSMVTVDLDRFGPEARQGLCEEIIKKSGLPLFEGTVEHGYAKRAVGSTYKCPLCGTPTEQCNANFVYATDKSTRVMLAPAGYFCRSCPTVIIDEEIIATGMKLGYRFRCVVGIDYGGKKHFGPFSTWNGKKPVYFLDEDEQIMDMATEDELRAQAPPPFRPRDRNKEKRKRKMERKARKRNRR
jgi:hypothetical protein